MLFPTLISNLFRLLPATVDKQFPRLDALRFLTLLAFFPLAFVLSIIHGFLNAGISGVFQKVNNMTWVLASTFGGFIHALKGKPAS